MNVEELVEKLIDAAGAEFTTYDYYTLIIPCSACILREMRITRKFARTRGWKTVRTWSEICDITFGKDFRTHDMASRILREEIEHEAWFIEHLSMERDGVARPSGHFRRGAPGEAPYSKNAGFYNP